MNRAILGVAGVMAGLAVVACGSAAASSGSTSTPSPSAGARRGLAGNAAFGQLVQINGSTLILSGTNGDSTVTYAATTTITQTNTGTVADIAAGSCITATGTKSGGGGTFSPRPSFSPPAAAAGFTAARGQVKSVTGTSVAITGATGTITTIDVPTTVKVTTST